MKTTMTLRPTQRGTVLVVSLVLLVGVTLVSLSSINTGMMELIMSGNEEARMTAFQKAQAGVESVIANESNFTVVGLVGNSNCTASKSGETCSQTGLSFPAGIDANKQWAKTERLNPLLACPPRVFATSCDSFKVAHFSVDSHFSDVAVRGGRSQVVGGFMVVIPLPGEEKVVTGDEITQ
jgi:hypothetical protein